MSEFSPFSVPLTRVAPSELKEFYSISEGWYVEYKSQPISPKDMAKTLSSFANQYGGWLVLGVVEDKQDLTAEEFPGLSQQQVSNVIQTLRDASRDCVNPEVFYEHRVFNGPIDDIDLPDGQSIIVVRIPQGPVPPYVHLDARIYRRVADSSAPKPETDQAILDRLFLRSQESRQRLARMVTRTPLTSKGEENSCFVHLTITSDPYEIGGHRFNGSFQDFSEIMGKDPIIFDNIYTNTDGFVARQVTTNDPYNRLLTWEFDRHCHSFITLPINTLTTRDERLASYDTGSSFGTLVNQDMYLPFRLLDLNIMFRAFIGIGVKHRELTAQANIEGPFYFKGHIENAWRKVPFLDMPSFLSHVQKFGVPVIQDDDLLTPPGTDLKSFGILPPITDSCGQTRPIVPGLDDAVKIVIPIFNALGIPPSLFPQAADELVAASRILDHLKISHA